MLDDAIINARQIQVVSYSNVAAFAFLVWELFITFTDEINFIWSTRSWSTKWAFVLLRYSALVVTFLNQSVRTGSGGCEKFNLCGASNCSRWYKFQMISMQVVIALQQFLMASRVYALYRRSRKIAIILAASFIVEHALITTFTVLTFPSVVYNNACFAVEVGPTVIGIGFPPILYDLSLLVLTLYKCMQSAPRRWHRIPLIWVLVRDGTWAFATVFGIFCLNSLLLAAVDNPTSSVALGWQFAVSSFAACRVVLQMYREAATRPFGGRLQLRTYVGGPSPHGRDRDRMSMESELALTTFLPGVEFEACELPDGWGYGA